MTWHQHRIWIIAVLVLTGIALVWLIMRTPVTPPAEEDMSVATTTPDLTGRAIYTNGEYGFVVSYPETAQLEEEFFTTYHLNDAWRVNADPEAEGDPIVAIRAYSTESDHSYPRYFHALVRIGASKDAKEIANCERVTPDRGETALPDAMFNGTTWKVFSFQQAGMQQYVRGVSYRTMHDGACIAVEKIAAGSNYQDDPDSPEDVPDALLEERYQGLGSIVESVTFAR
jgi:hypothetical protein